MSVRGGFPLRCARPPGSCPLGKSGLRKRRTYAEVEGTETYDIITSAGGPKPWRELTEREHGIIQSRSREKDEMRRAMAGLPRVTDFPSDIPLAGL
jgi:hypothetical protein